jgi:hypothetical protein
VVQTTRYPVSSALALFLPEKPYNSESQNHYNTSFSFVQNNCLHVKRNLVKIVKLPISSFTNSQDLDMNNLLIHACYRFAQDIIELLHYLFEIRSFGHGPIIGL